MNRFTERRAIITSFILLMTAAAIPAGTAETHTVIKLAKIVHACKQFGATHIHPSRYVLTSGRERPWPPAVYDIETGAIAQLPPIDLLPGLPRPAVIGATGPGATYERNRQKVRGDYWTWYDNRLVHYNPARNTAGLFLSQTKTEKFVDGNPPCKACKADAEFLQEYGRYYCRPCKKYVDEKDYLRDTVLSYYAELDLAARTVTWIKELERKWGDSELPGVRVIGTDPEGKYFYYCNNNYFYKREETTGRILVNRFNIAEQKVDWRYKISVPVREKDTAAGSYDISVEPSPDFSRLFFSEYDEAGAETPGIGWLKKPGPQGIILDLKDRSHFTVDIPVTPYGIAFNREGTHLIIGSNQTGVIHRVNLLKKTEEGRTQALPTIAKMLFSPSSKYLLSINKRSVEVYSWPSMTRVQNIAWPQIIPGVRELLTAEQMHVMGDRRHLVIGVLKPSGNGPWFSADLNGGFTLLRIDD